MQGLYERIGKRVRSIAPALVNRVGEQRITDHAFGERVAVCHLLPLATQVPVVRNVMVIKYHGSGHVGKQSLYRWQPADEAFEGLLFLEIPCLVVWRDLFRPVPLHPLPERR